MHFLIDVRFCILIAMNVPTIAGSGGTWDEALLPPQAREIPTPSMPVSNVVSTPQTASFDFSPDHSSGMISSTATSSVPSSIPITRLSLIPVIKQSQVPALPAGHILLPLSGVLVAATLLFIIQAVTPLWFVITPAPENFLADKLYSSVYQPVEGISDTVAEELSVAAFAAREKILVLQAVIDPVINQPVTVASVDRPNFTPMVAATTGVAPVIELLLSRLGQILSAFWDACIYYKNLAVTNWLNFWYGEPEVQNLSIYEETLRARIKAEVLAELRGDLSSLLSATSPTITQTRSGQGLVVVPQSQVGNEVEAVTKIKGLFSDPVLVDFDTTGQSGVITPLFGNTTGENYIFVLTPIAAQ